MLLGEFNDVQSLIKDEATGVVSCNLVKILQHHYKLSKDEAIEETIRIHNEDLKEYLALEKNLPDFGRWQEAVETFISYIGLFITGWQTISVLETDRYNKLGEFPSAEVIKGVSTITSGDKSI